MGNCCRKKSQEEVYSPSIDYGGDLGDVIAFPDQKANEQQNDHAYEEVEVKITRIDSNYCDQNEPKLTAKGEDNPGFSKDENDKEKEGDDNSTVVANGLGEENKAFVVEDETEQSSRDQVSRENENDFHARPDSQVNSATTKKGDEPINQIPCDEGTESMEDKPPSPEPDYEDSSSQESLGEENDDWMEDQEVEVHEVGGDAAGLHEKEEDTENADDAIYRESSTNTPDGSPPTKKPKPSSLIEEQEATGDQLSQLPSEGKRSSATENSEQLDEELCDILGFPPDDSVSVFGWRSFLPSLDKFPDPVTVTVLTHTPSTKVSGHLTWEDTFWTKKKDLIPDYKRMLVIDKRAMEAATDLKENPNTLVNYLVKDLTEIVEKVRVLMRWISENIAYDVQGRDTGTSDTSVESVLKNGKAVCAGYANVMERLCRLADIECQNASGVAKGASYYPGYPFQSENPQDASCAHAWNIVKIGDSWYHCDPTWASGAVKGNDNGGDVFEKQWDEWWFLTEPIAFLDSHFPLDKHGSVNMKQQLVPNPMDNIDEWSNTVHRDPVSYQLDIQPLSHTTGVIKIIRSAELHMQFQSPISDEAEYYAVLNEVREDGVRYERKNRVMVYSVEDNVHVHVRFPGKGKYVLRINVQFTGGELKHTNVMQYRIDCEHPGTKPPYPAGSNIWGESSRYRAAGFKVVSPKAPIVFSRNGIATVEAQLPTDGVVAHTCKLFCSSDRKEKFDHCIYAEKESRHVNFNVTLPRKGEFILELSYAEEPVSEQEGTYSPGARFLIISETGASQAKQGSNSAYLAGPHIGFHSKGLTTNVQSSTLASKNGIGILHILNKRNKKIFGKLFSQGTDITKKYLATFNNKDIFTFLVQTKDIGNYFLTVYAGEQEDQSLLPVAEYCIKADNVVDDFEPYELPLHYGFSNKSLDDILLKPRGFYLETKDATCEIQQKNISGNIDRHLFHLFHKGKKVDEYVSSENKESEIMYHFKLPHKGFYRFTYYLPIEEDSSSFKEAFSYLIYSVVSITTPRTFKQK